MNWKLFIDDERFPVDSDYIVARSSAEAIDLVKKFGFPHTIAFDHDLGGSDTSIAFIWWAINEYLDGKLAIPVHFTYTIHSQNPVGARNIQELLNAFLTHIRSVRS